MDFRNHWGFFGEELAARFAGGRGRGGRGGPFGPHGFSGMPPGGPGGVPPFGGGGFPWNFFQRPTRARRGDVRAGILALLAEQPRNGYQIMQELEQRSGGSWRPSSGSIYPALQQLEDEGLVEVEATSGGRTFRLSDKGRTYVEEHRDEVGAPWENVGEPAGEEWISLFSLVRNIAIAAAQVVHTGTPAQIERAEQLLADVRRQLYGILAESDPADDE